MIFTWSFSAFYDNPGPGKYGFSRSDCTAFSSVQCCLESLLSIQCCSQIIETIMNRIVSSELLSDASRKKLHEQTTFMKKITNTMLYRLCWDNVAQEYCLVNVVQIRLRQHCTKAFFCAMLAQTAQTCFYRTITYTILSRLACANIAQENYLYNVYPQPMNKFEQ